MLDVEFDNIKITEMKYSWTLSQTPLLHAIYWLVSIGLPDYQKYLRLLLKFIIVYRWYHMRDLVHVPATLSTQVFVSELFNFEEGIISFTSFACWNARAGTDPFLMLATNSLSNSQSQDLMWPGFITFGANFNPGHPDLELGPACEQLTLDGHPGVGCNVDTGCQWCWSPADSWILFYTHNTQHQGLIFSDETRSQLPVLIIQYLI